MPLGPGAKFRPITNSSPKGGRVQPSRIANVCLVLGAAACTSVRPVEPSKLVASQLPPVVSVTYPDKTVLVVMRPALSADTLKGLRWGTEDSVAIPLDSVRTVDARVRDRTKTLLLAAAAGLVVAAGAYIVSGSPGQEDLSLRVCSSNPAREHPDQYPQCY